MRDKSWQTELEDSRKAVVSVAHLVVCAPVWRIPLMLKEILKSVGSRVDKLWTCTEYQCLATWAEYTTAAHLYRFIQSEATRFGIHFCNSTHLDPVNQPSLIIIVQRQLSSFITTTLAPGPGSSLSPCWNTVPGISEHWPQIGPFLMCFFIENMRH